MAAAFEPRSLSPREEAVSEAYMSNIRKNPFKEPVLGSPAMHRLFIDQRVTNDLFAHGLMNERTHRRISKGIDAAVKAGSEVLPYYQGFIGGDMIVEMVINEAAQGYRTAFTRYTYPNA